LQLKVDVPEPVTLVGLRVQVRPVAGEIVNDSDTIPLNPLRAVTVIVDVPEPGDVNVILPLAAIVKS
jgi:hypothetical protein